GLRSHRVESGDGRGGKETGEARQGGAGLAGEALDEADNVGDAAADGGGDGRPRGRGRRLDRCPYLRPDGADLVDVLDDEDNGRDEGDEGENDPRRWAGELGGIESPLSRRHDLRRDGHGLGDDTVGEPGRLSRGERRALSNEGPGDADQ